METSSALSRTIAGVRFATPIFFLLFGEYKVARPGFAHSGFQTYLQDYITNSAVRFYRPVLPGLFLAHAVFFGLCGWGRRTWASVGSRRTPPVSQFGYVLPIENSGEKERHQEE